MSIKALILLTLLAQTPHHRDSESWEEREDRLALVADAIDKASLRATCQGPWKSPEDAPEACTRLWPGSRKALAMLLVTQAIHETHLSAEVHANRCRLEMGECDARWYYDHKQKKRVYVQQSYSLWQIKKFQDIPYSDWEQIQLGVDGTHYAAWHAARRLASAYRSCGSINGAISRYAVGNGCAWDHAHLRVKTFHELFAAVPYTLKKNRDVHRARLVSRDLLVSND